MISAFEGDDFTRDAALSGEFLLGYHCQRQKLRTTSLKSGDAELVGTVN